MKLVFLFSNLKENTTNQTLNILKKCTLIRGNFKRFQVFNDFFPSIATTWFGLKTQFSQLTKSQMIVRKCLIK